MCGLLACNLKFSTEKWSDIFAHVLFECQLDSIQSAVVL